jgi:two-component system response regulator PilR (NtrC family)
VLALRVPTLRERHEDIPVLAGAILEHLAVRYGDPHPKRLAATALQRLSDYAFPGNVRELENLLERAYAFAEGATIEVDDLGPLDAGTGHSAAARASAPMSSAAPAPGPALPGADAPPLPAARASMSAVSGFPPDLQPDRGLDPHPEAQPAALGEGAGEGCRATFPIDLPGRLEALERDLILQALQQTGFNRTAAAPLLGLSFRQLRYRIQQLGIREGRDDLADGAAADPGEAMPDDALGGLLAADGERDA